MSTVGGREETPDAAAGEFAQVKARFQDLQDVFVSSWEDTTTMDRQYNGTLGNYVSLEPPSPVLQGGYIDMDAATGEDDSSSAAGDAGCTEDAEGKGYAGGILKPRAAHGMSTLAPCLHPAGGFSRRRELRSPFGQLGSFPPPAAFLRGTSGGLRAARDSMRVGKSGTSGQRHGKEDERIGAPLAP